MQTPTTRLIDYIGNHSYQTINLEIIKGLILEGANPCEYNSELEGNVLFWALERLYSSEIINELIKNGYERNQKIVYYETIPELLGPNYIRVKRLKTIENIILIHYHVIFNDPFIDMRIIERHKKKPSYKSDVSISKPKIIGPKLPKNPIIPPDITIISDSSEYFDLDDTIPNKPLTDEEFIEHRKINCEKIKIKIDQYCDLFSINLQELVKRGEEYPDDLKE
jgi:hypothetical protein